MYFAWVVPWVPGICNNSYHSKMMAEWHHAVVGTLISYTTVLFKSILNPCTYVLFRVLKSWTKRSLQTKDVLLFILSKFSQEDLLYFT